MPLTISDTKGVTGEKAASRPLLPTLLCRIFDERPLGLQSCSPFLREPSGSVRTLFLWGIGHAKIRRTEVRPMFRRRAISDLLTPARCSFRTGAA